MSRPCLGDPLAGVRLVPRQDYVRDMSVGLDNLLDTLHVIGDHAPHVTMTAVHLVSPSMEHRDRGKSRLHVDLLDAGASPPCCRCRLLGYQMREGRRCLECCY